MPRTRTVTMTKAQVIHAIRVETNLDSGLWIKWPEGEEPDESNCSVCAVGAVLWEGAVPPEKIDDVADSLTEDATSPFTHLSAVFESAFWGAAGVEGARNAAIRFVEKHFPPKIRFSYNGEAVWVQK